MVLAIRSGRSVRGGFGEIIPVFISTAVQAMALADPPARASLWRLIWPARMPGGARRTARVPWIPIVIISARQQPELIAAARALGAAGYLSKAQPLDALLGSLKRVLAGEVVFPAGAKGAEAGAARDRIAVLSGAQLRVLLALADGRLNKQIAGDLGVTEATVKAHMTAIFRKLGVNNRTQAILAMQPLLGEPAGETP